MATKNKQESKVTRIKAVDTAEIEVTSTDAATKVKKVREPKEKVGPKGILRPLFAIGGYFKGAWFELRQVRWPNRRATWGLTLAVLLFTAFFIALIVLLDAGFKYLFNLILG